MQIHDKKATVIGRTWSPFHLLPSLLLEQFGQTTTNATDVLPHHNGVTTITILHMQWLQEALKVMG